MKIINLLTTILLFFAVSLSAQTYIEPIYKGKSTSAVDVDKVEITKTYTIVHMSCTAPEEFVYGGWACLTNTSYIQDIDTKKTYSLIKVKGIPTCPNKYNFTKPGQTIHFKLFFPPVRHNVRKINIIEDLDNVANPFNFFNVLLKPLA